MSSIFDAALTFTLRWEGGYVNDPVDNGGETNKGITHATYDSYRHSHGLPTRSVELIARNEVAEIYQSMYWMKGFCDRLPAKIAIAHFDWCVNHGPTGATKTLQEALGVTADGIIGPKTRAAIEAACATPGGADRLVANYLTLRGLWYHNQIVQHPSQKRYENGWNNRLESLRKYLTTVKL